MKEYLKPQIEIIDLSDSDIIMESGNSFGGNFAGDNPFDFNDFFS